MGTLQISDNRDFIKAEIAGGTYWKGKYDRLTAELEVKDKLLQKVLSYGEEGLTIDETFANEIEQVLKGEKE